MTNDHELLDTTATRVWIPHTLAGAKAIGTERILEHKDGDRNFRGIDEVEAW